MKTLNPLRWFQSPVVSVQLPAQRSAAKAGESAMNGATAVTGLPASVTTKAAAVPAAASVASAEAKVKTWLDNAGNWFKGLLGIGVGVAEVAEPFVDVAVPEVAGLYHMSVGLAVAAQATWAETAGTGEDKLAEVTAKMKPQVDQFFGGDAEAFGKWFSAFVTSLHLIDPKASAAKFATSTAAQ